MTILFNIFIFFWFVRTLKAILFWIYLWQLKEYHVGRFSDHFRTHKGKKVFLNLFFASKLFLLLLFFVLPNISFFLLLFVYAFESLLIMVKGAKRPFFTLKTILLTVLLTAVLIALVIIFLDKVYWSLDIISSAVSLLLFDIFLPIIVSAVVLLIQPLFVVMRNRILRKAKDKILKYNNLTVIGITGSYGKTSTKEFLTTILSTKFKVLATKDHKNSEMGIAQTILEELKPEHKIFVVEMGAYSRGGIRLLCDIVNPSIGMVTGVNEQHLATFRSMENILSAEGGRELLEKLPKDGLLIVNGDNKYCVDLYKKANINKKIYSVRNDKVDSDIWSEEITINKDSLDFLAMTRDRGTMHFNVNVLGRQNIQNLLGAILVARELGMSLEEISKAVKNIRQEQAGITLKKGIHGINIIDSSYSSNPDGVMADLDYLNVFKGKKVIIMPCLIELGKKSAEVHSQIGKKIAEVCDMAIITTKDKFEEIKESAIENGMSEDKIIFSEKPKEILHLITTSCKENDVVLLEGRVPAGLIKLLTR